MAAPSQNPAAHGRAKTASAESQAAGQNEHRIDKDGGRKADGKGAERHQQRGDQCGPIAPEAASGDGNDGDGQRCGGDVEPARAGRFDTEERIGDAQQPEKEGGLVRPDGEKEGILAPAVKRPIAVDRLVLSEREAIEQGQAQCVADQRDQQETMVNVVHKAVFDQGATRP